MKLPNKTIDFKKNPDFSNWQKLAWSLDTFSVCILDDVILFVRVLYKIWILTEKGWSSSFSERICIYIYKDLNILTSVYTSGAFASSSSKFSSMVPSLAGLSSSSSFKFSSSGGSGATGITTKTTPSKIDSKVNSTSI